MERRKSISERDHAALHASETCRARFSERVTRTAECHLFSTNSEDGYGHFCVEHGLTMRAQRFSLLLATGAPPKPGMYACHKCRNRNCVNPAHLYWGTSKQNAADRLRDGTENHRCGKKHFRAKLTDGKARDIVRLYASGVLSTQAIADKFGVTGHCVQDVLSGKTWRAATEGLRVPMREMAARAIKKGSKHHMAKINARSVPSIRRRWAEGISSITLAAEYDVAPRTIRDVGNRLTWKHVP